MMYISPFSREASDEKEKKTFKQQLHRLVRDVRGSVAGIWQVLQLVWETNRWLTLGLGLFTLLQALTPAISIYVTKLLIDAVVRGIEHRNVISQYLNTIILLVVLELVVSLLNSLFSTLANTYRQLLQDAITNQVQYMIMAHANTLDQTFFEQSKYYDKLQNAQREAGFRPVHMVSGVFDLIRSLVVFLSMIFLLARLQWLLAMIVLLTPIPAFISNTKYGWWRFQMSQRQALVRRVMFYLTHVLCTDFYHKEIKIFHLGDFFLGRFKVQAKRLYDENRSLLTKRSTAGFLWGMLTILASSGTFLYVAVQALYGFITLGDLTLYTQAANSVQNDFQSVLTGIADMYENNLYLSTLFELLSLKPRIRNPERPVPLQLPFLDGIEFRNVSFQYEGSEEAALQNVSFTLHAGETLAVVGRNGAGKTTLVKLLARLYDPQEGEILVNGQDIRNYDLAELRKTIGVIFQDYVRYHLTAQENIGLGNLAQLEDRVPVEIAATKSGADEVIAKLPNGYDTMLGRWFEEGHELSGGEWQKIALARAFMREAQILILDEPTAALDAKSEYELFLHIRDLTRGRTAIFISHRFSTVRLADHILVLEEGRMIEYGSHEELLALDGQYAELFNLQAASYK